MIQRSKRHTKRRSKKYTRRNKSQKTVGFIYYKMNQCKYCKQFERELWLDLTKYCKKKSIKTHIVVRELNPELIPNKIKTYPSLVKYDKKNKKTIFDKERTLNNLKRFLN